MRKTSTYNRRHGQGAIPTAGRCYDYL